MDISATSGYFHSNSVNPPPVIPTIESLSNELRAARAKATNIFRSAIAATVLGAVLLLGAGFVVVPVISLTLLSVSAIFLIIGLVQFVRYAPSSHYSQREINEREACLEGLRIVENPQLQNTLILMKLSVTLCILYTIKSGLQSNNFDKMRQDIDCWLNLATTYNQGINAFKALDKNKKQQKEFHSILTNIYRAHREINAQLDRLCSNPQNSGIQVLRFSLDAVPLLPV